MPKVVVVYLSTSGNTKAMADAIVEGAQSRNVEAKAMNFNEAKIEELKEADAIAIGSSTFYYKMLPPMEKFMEVIDPVLRIQYQPVEKDLEECKRLGKDIAVQIKKKYTVAGSEPKSGDAPIMHEVKMGEGGH